VVNGFKPARKNNLESEGLKPSPTKTHGVFEIVRALKTFSSRQMNKLLEIENRRKIDITKRWQRSFYDRIIRNEIELNNVRNYIINNPKNWDKITDHNSEDNKFM
jgi:putative transposase